MCQHPTLTLSRADGVTRSNERLGDEAQAPNDTPATHPKPQRFQTVILVTQTIMVALKQTRCLVSLRKIF